MHPRVCATLQQDLQKRNANYIADVRVLLNSAEQQHKLLSTFIYVACFIADYIRGMLGSGTLALLRILAHVCTYIYRHTALVHWCTSMSILVCTTQGHTNKVTS